ncbi:hypothetical protein ACWDA7_50365 [Streptomyces sp. NPDC001156]
MSSLASPAGSDSSDSPLEDVTLDYFYATPPNLEPFDASVLRWKVEAPPGVHIELAGIDVPAVGEQLVAPVATRTYQLVARERDARRVLGQVRVVVDLVHCRISDLSFLDAIIKAGILADPGALPSGTYFREDPKVTITPERIHIHLFLGRSIKWFRDPVITMDMSFGLTVVPDLRSHGSLLGPVFTDRATRFAPVAEEYTADVSEPWYVFALGGFALAIALAMAKDAVTARIPGIIERVVDGLDGDFHPAGFEGLQKQHVDIGVDDKNIGFLEVNWCPPPAIDNQQLNLIEPESPA